MSDHTTGLRRRERPAANPSKPAGAMVLLHGRGSDGDDLFPLIDMIDPESLLHGVTLQAPTQYEGMPGYHWYVVERVGHPDEPSFFASLELIHAELDALCAELGVTMADVIVGGFSQGAVMSVASALSTGRPKPAAVFEWSGFVPTVEGWDLDPDVAAGVGVLATHGIVDPIIPVHFGRVANERLTEAGANVEYREATMGHEIDPETILRARELVTTRFA